MITDANGKPIVTESMDGRSIKLTEVMSNGKPSWAVDFSPSVSSFEFEEVMMILGDVTRALAQNTLARIREARAMEKVKYKMDEINKEK